MASSVALRPGFVAAGPPAALDRAEVEALCAHPRFAETLKLGLRALLELYRRDGLLNRILNDRGRAVTAAMALYLHYAARPDDPATSLTVSRLTDRAVAAGVASRGRVAAFVALMRWAGYLAPDVSQPDRRARRLLATDRLIDLHQARWKRLLAAAAPVSSDAGAVLQGWTPRFVRPYALALSEPFDGGFRLLDASPDLMPFGERNAGLLILARITLDHLELSAAGEARSISGLARLFAVSRPHVIKLVRDAHAAGLLCGGSASPALSPTPRLARAMERFVASLLVLQLTAARAALANCA